MTESESPNPEATASVTVYRTKRALGVYSDVPVFCDGEGVADLANGARVTCEVLPGTRVFSTFPNAPTVTLQVAAGEAHFLRTVVAFPRPAKLEIVTAEVADNDELETFKRTDPIAALYGKPAWPAFLRCARCAKTGSVGTREISLAQTLDGENPTLCLVPVCDSCARRAKASEVLKVLLGVTIGFAAIRLVWTMALGEEPYDGTMGIVAAALFLFAARRPIQKHAGDIATAVARAAVQDRFKHVWPGWRAIRPTAIRWRSARSARPSPTATCCLAARAAERITASRRSRRLGPRNVASPSARAPTLGFGSRS